MPSKLLNRNVVLFGRILLYEFIKAAQKCYGLYEAAQECYGLAPPLSFASCLNIVNKLFFANAIVCQVQ